MMMMMMVIMMVMMAVVMMVMVVMVVVMAVVAITRLMVMAMKQTDQADGGRQAQASKQGRDRPVTMQHRRPLEGQGPGHKPGDQAGCCSRAQTHHRRPLAVGGILLHLMEVGTEQHEGGGQGRA